ncbi:MAG TPA: J domain-containing protein, partial [bacterium]
APLGAKHVLLRGTVGNATTTLVVNPTGWKVEDELKSPAAEQVAVSPTGRYALVGDSKAVRLMTFALPEAPMDYVRRLRDMKALKTAQNYVRMLDDNGLPARTKANLTAELNRTSPGAALQDALENLARARKEGNRENTRYWAEQVLNLQPRQPDALEALKDVKLAADKAVLDQARQALDANKPTQAISLLSTQIGPDSPVREDANALIKQAEGRRGQEITLEQAREKLNLGEFPAAAALVEQVLRQDKENPAALSLKAEIASRGNGSSSRQFWPFLIGATLAALIMAFVWKRYQATKANRKAVFGAMAGAMGNGHRPMPRPRPEGPTTAAPLRPRPAPKPSPAAPRALRPEPPVPERRSLARQQVVEAAQEKAEDLLRLARMADVSREHTALFMGLEAELVALRRRLGDPMSDLGPMHNRLKAIAEELRTLKFTDPPQGPPPEPPPAVPPVGTEEPTWYEVLKVSPGASEGEIKSAYLRLLKEYHPDLHNASSFGWVKAEAERMSRMIGQAFEVLSNSERRQAYDRQLARERPGAAPRRQQGARE